MNCVDQADDTLLDALAAQARTYPELPLETVGRLLRDAHDQPGGPAQGTLVRHHLSVALARSLARRDSGLEIRDLYQEASVAVVTAIDEFAARGGDASHLREYVGRVVDMHLDAAIEREAEERRTEEALVAETRLLEAAEVELRHRLGRPPTTLELAALLELPAQRIEALSEILREARVIHDESLIPFLDDVDDDESENGT